MLYAITILRISKERSFTIRRIGLVMTGRWLVWYVLGLVITATGITVAIWLKILSSRKPANDVATTVLVSVFWFVLWSVLLIVLVISTVNFLMECLKTGQNHKPKGKLHSV